MTTVQTSLADQVATLISQVRSQQQLTMVNDLKSNGLLVVPKFNLAYGPVSFANQQNRK